VVLIGYTPRLKKRAPGTHWIGGWMSPRAVLNAMVKRKDDDDDVQDTFSGGLF